MVQEHDHKNDTPAERVDSSRLLRRSWTQRNVQPVKYQRYSDLDAGGTPRIFFKFELPPGHDKPEQAILDIKEKWKTINGCPTGLKVVNDRVHGKTWRLPDNKVGRTAADFIDVDLLKLAHKMTDEPGFSR